MKENEVTVMQGLLEPGRDCVKLLSESEILVA